MNVIQESCHIGKALFLTIVSHYAEKIFNWSESKINEMQKQGVVFEKTRK